MKYSIDINITCGTCIDKVKKTLGEDAKLVDYNFTKQRIIIEMNEANKILFIVRKLQKAGFEVGSYKEYKGVNNYFINSLIIGILIILVILGTKFFPSIEFGTEFSIILVVVFGVLSSFHCISMCGPIALKQHSINKSFQYHLGRIISYSAVGFILGLLGGVISINETFVMFIGIVAGILLILLGLSSIDVIKIPRIKYNVKNDNKSSFVIGLLNGVLPCAVLQIMWIYVLTLANPFYGLLTMFIIAVISSTALYCFSVLGTKLTFFRSKAFKIILAIYIILIGFNMVNSSFKQLKATSNEVTTTEVSASPSTSQEYILDENYILNTGSIPVNTEVTINVDGDKMNGCSEKFFVTFPDGQSIYVDTTKVDSFTVTPTETGTVTIECWMSMRGGSFEVE